MDINTIKQEFANRDRVISGLTSDGRFRIAAIKNTKTAKDAQQQHHLPAIPALLLSRQLTAASLLAVFLKGEERIILEATGSGLIQNVFAEAIQVGEVRGYVRYSPEINNFDNTDLLQLFTDGNYKVTRILYNKNEPVTGIVSLVNGDIASDLTYYLFQSEQIPSAVILDTDMTDDGQVNLSSGLIIQAMPGTTVHDLNELHRHISGIKSLNSLFAENSDLMSVIKQIIPYEFNVFKNDPVDFFCRCSKESFMSKLITFGIDEIKSLQDENKSELVCQYCNKHYYLDDHDFNNLITTLQAKQN